MKHTAGEVSVMVGKSKQTIVNWDKYSAELESRGLQRLIPRPELVAGTRYWTTEQVEEIKKFSKSIVYGLMAEYNRYKWGKRGSVKE